MKLLQLTTAAVLLSIPAGALAGETEETPICTDRPTKANAVCTVPVGKWQLESSAIGWAKTEADGSETKLLALGSSVAKLGLTDRSDLQIAIVPYVHVETKAAGNKSSVSGFGDVTLRYKHRLTGDGSKIQIAAIPFVKLPTADRDIGNGKVEGGLAVPVSMAVGRATLTFGPEADLVADLDGNGRHVAVVNLVNLAGPVAPGLTLVGELWTATNFDPADRTTLASADAALAYAVNPNLQLDLGANLGLNSATTDLEVYAGVSFRF